MYDYCVVFALIEVVSRWVCEHLNGQWRRIGAPLYHGPAGSEANENVCHRLGHFPVLRVPHRLAFCSIGPAWRVSI